MEAKKKKRKVILVGLGIAATAIAGYFGFEYYQKNKRRKEDDAFASAKYSLPAPPKAAFVPSTYTTTTVKRNDDFPLKKGSRGTKVKAVQEALIAKYGSSILPKYGADGDFGSEMSAALTKANLPTVIDESTYNVLVHTSSLNASELAKTLHNEAANSNLNAVIASLKKMRSTSDYSSVSTEFKKYSLRGVSQTLVNGLLGSFSDEDSKQQIRMEFLRMGLKYNGTKWTLSGLDGFKVITTTPTVVWRNPREGARVPAKMVLGTEIAEHRGFTLFENNGRRFIVKTSTVKYI